MGALDVGSKVQVRTDFDHTWASGFEVVEPCRGEGYLLRRVSDGRVLPRRFPSDDVRRERRDNDLWWV